MNVTERAEFIIRIHHFLVLKILEPGPKCSTLIKNTFNFIVPSSRYLVLPDRFSRTLFSSWLTAFAFITKWKWSFELNNILWAKSCKDIMTHRGKERHGKCKCGSVHSFLSFLTNRVVFLTVLWREQTCKAKCKSSILIWIKALIESLWAGSKEKISPFCLLHILILDKQGLNSHYSWAVIDTVSFLCHRKLFVYQVMNKLTSSEWIKS